MTKLRGKARQAYRKQQAKMRKSAQEDLHKHSQRDPNIALYTHHLKQLFANPSGGQIITTFAHLEPKRIITDTVLAYEAIYEDENGEYTWSIYRADDGYRIIADGIEMFKTSIDNILWDFETQLSVYGPKVLGGRTFQGKDVQITTVEKKDNINIKTTYYKDKPKEEA